MYPLHTDNYTAATCYSLINELVHHLHNINSAYLHSRKYERAAGQKISVAIDLLMIAAIDSAAHAAKKIDIMLKVAEAEECLDAAVAELTKAVERSQASPTELIAVVLRGLEATLAAVHTLAIELGKKESTHD